MILFINSHVARHVRHRDQGVVERQAHLPRELPLEHVTDIVMPYSLPAGAASGSMRELEALGLTRDTIKETLGPNIMLHVESDFDAAKKLARKLSCSNRPVYHPGFIFNTSKTETRYHPPTGLIVPNPQIGPAYFRFKASIGVSFNIVLASDPFHVCEGKLAPGASSGKLSGELSHSSFCYSKAASMAFVAISVGSASFLVVDSTACFSAACLSEHGHQLQRAS